jgi:hypothetical protein
MNRTLRAAALGAAAASDERRGGGGDVRRQDRHELALWFEPVQDPATSVCEGCHKEVPFVIWMTDRPGWRCTVCADGGTA